MFNLFDIFFILILSAGCLFGFQTGFIASAFYAAAGFIAMAAAHAYAAKAGANFYVAFIVTAGAVILAGFLLSTVVKVMLLGLFDRIGGAVLGILLGIVTVIFIVTTLPPKFSVQSRTLLLASFTATHVLQPVRKFHLFAPGGRRWSSGTDGSSQKKTYNKIFSALANKLNVAVTKRSGEDSSGEKKRIQ